MAPGPLARSPPPRRPAGRRWPARRRSRAPRLQRFQRPDRRAAGSHHVLDDHAPVPGLEQRALDPAREAMRLGLLAHEERLHRRRPRPAPHRRSGRRPSSSPPRPWPPKRRPERPPAGQRGEPGRPEDRSLGVDQIRRGPAAGQNHGSSTSACPRSSSTSRSRAADSFVDTIGPAHPSCARGRCPEGDLQGAENVLVHLLRAGSGLLWPVCHKPGVRGVQASGGGAVIDGSRPPRVRIRPGQPKRFIDGAARALTSPFRSFLTTSSEWATEIAGTLLALILYGFGLGYLARWARM